MSASGVQIVEVGLRDGFQSIGPFIPTSEKIATMTALYRAGLRRMEVTSFVSRAAVPQLADAEDLLAAAAELAGLDAQILVPTARQAERALAAGADHLAFVLSVSEAHNRSNVRRTPAESVEDFAALVALTGPALRIRLNLATAFDCPFDGAVDPGATLRLLETLIALAPNAEIALCDTTGRVTPAHVRGTFAAAAERFPAVTSWAFHAHDTFGMGAANVLAAWDAGVRTFDSSVGGLGGCPFAPGATGNVATEDLIWMFDGMAVPSGVALDRLVNVAARVACLPGALMGGRVRTALQARRCDSTIEPLYEDRGPK